MRDWGAYSKRLISMILALTNHIMSVTGDARAWFAHLQKDCAQPVITTGN